MPFLRVRGRWLAPAAALSLGVVAVAVGRSLPRAADAPPVVFLGAVAAGVLTLLALAAPPATAYRIAALSVLLVPLLARPLDDPTPWAIAFALLTAVTIGAVLAIARSALDVRPLAHLAWATAAQWILHADRIWQGPRDTAALGELVVAPVLAGLLVGRTLRRRPRLGLVGAALAFSTGPGWTPGALLALVAVAVGSAAAARRRPTLEPLAVVFGALPGAFANPRLAVALATLGVVALLPTASAERSWRRRFGAALAPVALAAVASGAVVTLAAGAPPWSLDRPLPQVLESVARQLGSRPYLLHEGRSLRLEGEPLRFDSPGGLPIRTLSLDSFLLDGAGLECGRPVAELALVVDDRTVWSTPVVAGAATGDWAAERADVAARAACDPPRALLRWPAPGGRFLSRRYRAIWEVDPPLAASRLELRPVAPDPATRLVVIRLAIGS